MNGWRSPAAILAIIQILLILGGGIVFITEVKGQIGIVTERLDNYIKSVDHRLVMIEGRVFPNK